MSVQTPDVDALAALGGRDVKALDGPLRQRVEGRR